jgi:hypothetical protein
MRRVAISDMFGSGSAMVNNGADGGESQNSPGKQSRQQSPWAWNSGDNPDD